MRFFQTIYFVCDLFYRDQMWGIHPMKVDYPKGNLSQKKLHYLALRPIFIYHQCLEFLHYSNHQNHPIWFLVEVSIWYHRYSYGGQLVHHKRRRREPCGSCRLTPRVFFIQFHQCKLYSNWRLGLVRTTSSLKL